eukprot:36055_1
MRLIHLTDYYGEKIMPHKSKQNHDIDLDLIWIQAVPHHTPCCPGFGKREVDVNFRHLFGQEPVQWNLWQVSCTKGNQKEMGFHYFYTFIFMPIGHRNLGKKSLRRRGWKQVGTINPQAGCWSALRDILKAFWDDNINKNHTHIGAYLHKGLVAVPSNIMQQNELDESSPHASTSELLAEINCLKMRLQRLENMPSVYSSSSATIPSQYTSSHGQRYHVQDARYEPYHIRLLY